MYERPEQWREMSLCRERHNLEYSACAKVTWTTFQIVTPKELNRKLCRLGGNLDYVDSSSIIQRTECVPISLMETF